MPEYLAPGVYVEEIEIGGKPIEGVSTSTAGLLGETERGPVKPTLITGFTQFTRLYGGYTWEGQTRSSYLPYAVEGFFANGGKRCFIGRVAADSKPATLSLDGGKGVTINATGPGSWGSRVGVTIAKATAAKNDVPAAFAATFAKLFKVTVEYWSEAAPKAPEAPAAGGAGGGAAAGGGGPAGGGAAAAPASDAAKPPEPAVREVFDNVSADPSSSDFYVKRINAGSTLITIPSDDPAASTGVRPKDTPTRVMLKGGDDIKDKDLKDSHFVGKEEMGSRTGLCGFAEIDEIAIVAAPNDAAVPNLTDKLVTHCENLKDRVAVLDIPSGQSKIEALYPPKDSKYAAIYYPWIKIIDPDTGLEKLIPPSGHTVGIYARSDIERGVHKAPANEVIRGAMGLEFALTKGDQDLLNPRGVNCLRTFVGRGIRVWGARTCSSDPLWKYVNVRRLMNFIEESIDEGTQWVVFEPNDQRLWARVRQTISDFLTRVWKDGALMGTAPEQAFFVKCDETTMTPSDIETGRLICLIGVAPVRPAEFVIFRIAQWRSGSAISE